MRVRKRAHALLLIAGVLLTATAQAQATSCNTGTGNNVRSCSVPVTPTLTVGKLATLVLPNGPSLSLAPATTGGSISGTDFANGGYDVAATVSVQVRANTAWSATVSTTSTKFNAPCSGKNSSDLLWGTAPTTRTAPLTLTSADSPAARFGSGGSNTGANAVPFTLYFRVGLNWLTDPPGVCSLPLTFGIKTQ